VSGGGGLYVVVEGVDGAGKTELVSRLGERFPASEALREPADTPPGRAFREMARDGGSDPLARVFALVADRAEHLARDVRPALSSAPLVLQDRGHHSTYAYQAAEAAEAAGVGLRDFWRELDRCYAGWNVEPDLVLWLDADPAAAAARCSGEEHWATEDGLREVRLRYTALADERGFERLDAGAQPAAVADEAEAAVESGRIDDARRI
jgi:dTMP kinase